MAEFITAFQKTIINEGGYVNDPIDPGGETYKGISRKNWSKWLGWNVIDLLKKMPDFPANLNSNAVIREEVGKFYLANFWNKIDGDEIKSQVIAESIFDFAVNTGVNPAVSLAQQVVKVKNDGLIGNNTITAINSCNEELFIEAYKVKKIERYVAICKKRPESKKYFYGWVVRTLNLQTDG